MSRGLISKIDILRDRAQMFSEVRSFFAKKHVCEVDVPFLCRAASIDAQIDLVEATCMGEKSFLHSSPEYGMKRLLSEGIGDIYQLSHAFRDGENGEKHNPEFTLLEWYRVGFSFDEIVEETVDLIHLFFEHEFQVERMTYSALFYKYLGYFPHSIEQRDYHLALEIEPYLGKNGLSVITGYPAEQAALARIGADGYAERFEVYLNGVELANGYHELSAPQDQRARFENANRERICLGKTAYPLDENFLGALEKGLPDCCGVAVGFDRLMMLRHDLNHIEEVIPFGWNRV